MEFISCFIWISMPEGRNFIGLSGLWIPPCLTSQGFSAWSAYPKGWEMLQMASRARKIFLTQQQSFLQITVAEQSAQAAEKQQFRVCAVSTHCREVLLWSSPRESWNSSAILLSVCVCICCHSHAFYGSFSEIHPIMGGYFRKNHWFLIISSACHIKPNKKITWWWNPEGGGPTQLWMEKEYKNT